MPISGSGVSLGTLSIEIQAQIDEAVRELKKFGNETGRLVEEQTKQFEKLGDVGRTLSGVGVGLTAAITAPLVGLAAASVKAASDFESSMNKITAVSGTTGAELDELRKLATKLGADTKFSANEAAEGMGNLAAAGFKTNEIIAAMPGVLDLAAAGEMSVARAAEVTTATLGQFGLGASEAGRVADVFAQGAAASAISVNEMAQAMVYAGPIAKSAGISLEEMATATALLGNAGIKGEQAGTALRGVISSLISPSKEAAATIAELGVKTTDAAGKMLPLDQVFAQLKKTGADTADMFAIFGQNAASAAAVMTQQAGPAWAKMTEEIGKSDGAAKKMAETLNKGFKGALEQFSGSIETAMKSIGEVLLPVLTQIVTAGTKFINDWILPAIEAFGKLDPKLQGIILAFAGLAAAIGPLILIAGQLAMSISAIGTTVGPLLTMLGSGSGLAGLLTIATPLAIAFGAAIAAWGIYQAVTQLQALNTEWERLEDIQKRGITITAEQRREIQMLESAIAEHNQTVGNQRIEIDRTWKSIDEYIQKLREGTKQIKGFDVGVEGLTVSLGNLTLRSQKGAAELQKMKDEILESERKAKLYAQALAELGRKTGEVSTKTEEVKQKFHAAKTELEKLFDAIQIEKLRTFKGEQQELARVIAAYEIEARKGKDTTEEWIKKTDALNTNMLGAGGTINTIAQVQMPQLLTQLNAAITTTAGVDSAFKTLGITSSTEFAKVAAEAAKARDVVLGSDQASDFDKQTAVYKALKAQVEAAQHAGVEVPKEQLKTLDEMKRQLEGKLPEQEGIWKNFGNSVSTVITNFAQDISKSLWDGDMSWGEKGKTLLKSLGQAVTSSFIEPAAAAIGKFISGAIADLLGGEGFGGVWGRIKDIGGSIGGIFGGGGGGAKPGIPGGGAGGAIGGAVSGAAGWIGAISGAVGAISGIIGNFQMKGMNETLALIEESTRYSMIHLFYILDKLNEYIPGIKDIHSYLYEHQAPAFAELIFEAQHASLVLDRLHYQGEQANEARYGQLEQMIAGIERIALGTERTVTMNLSGTDPEIVAARIAQQLRLQGASG